MSISLDIFGISSPTAPSASSHRNNSHFRQKKLPLFIRDKKKKTYPYFLRINSSNREIYTPENELCENVVFELFQQICPTRSTINRAGGKMQIPTSNPPDPMPVLKYIIVMNILNYNKPELPERIYATRLSIYLAIKLRIRDYTIRVQLSVFRTIILVIYIFVYFFCPSPYNGIFCGLSEAQK